MKTGICTCAAKTRTLTHSAGHSLQCEIGQMAELERRQEQWGWLDHPLEQRIEFRQGDKTRLRIAWLRGSERWLVSLPDGSVLGFIEDLHVEEADLDLDFGYRVRSMDGEFMTVGDDKVQLAIELAQNVRRSLPTIEVPRSWRSR